MIAVVVLCELDKGGAAILFFVKDFRVAAESSEEFLPVNAFRRAER